jgi:hypothetical protein
LDSNEKLLPLDALGLVMIVQGEQFGESSSFGKRSIIDACQRMPLK